VPRAAKSKEPGYAAGFLLSYHPKQSIVVMMPVLLNDHDLGIMIAPAIVMTARPATMKTAIMMAMLRDYYRSILCICGYSWQRNCNRAQSSQADKKCAHVFPPESAFTHRLSTDGLTRSSKL
jgi:hypothetical protein